MHQNQKNWKDLPSTDSSKQMILNDNLEKKRKKIENVAIKSGVNSKTLSKNDFFPGSSFLHPALLFDQISLASKQVNES